uniref:BHLH domain-containing protein n=1 Tax=Pelusios castaneus TaxID=367368 RepID=A0A8C8R749_9SAUR
MTKHTRPWSAMDLSRPGEGQGPSVARQRGASSGPGLAQGHSPPRPLQHKPDLCRSSRGAQSRAGGGQRQSASEREKLRMRNLSKALHTLRRYLPPSVAPAGQSLTKIETLRLACRYISHLAELLGLSEETLAQRREGAPRHCRLCPEGLGCCQRRSPGLQPASPAQREGPAPATKPWVSPTCCPAVGSPPELLWAQSPGALSWATSTSCFEMGTPPELHRAQFSDCRAWGSPTTCPMAGNPPEPHKQWITDTESWGSPHGCTDPPNSSGIGATPARPWTSPTHRTLLSAFHQVCAAGRGPLPLPVC